MIKELLSNAFTTELNPGNFRPDGYLGMSMIGGCPTAAYDSYFGDKEVDMRQYWYGFSGRAYEDAIRNLLSLHGTVIPKEHYWYNIVADFDHRYRGHADILMITPEDNLIIIDVKSLSWEKFDVLKRGAIEPYSHDKNVAQVQAYMFHTSAYASHPVVAGAIIYTPRDIPHREWREGELNLLSDPFPFGVVNVWPDTDVQYHLDQKAQMILRMIDNRERPTCTCGYCKQDVLIEDEIPF